MFYKYLMKKLNKYLSDENSNNHVLAESNIDHLSNICFFNSNPTFTSPKSDFIFDDSEVTHYLIGNSVMSIKIGKMGWIQLTIRRFFLLFF